MIETNEQTPRIRSQLHLERLATTDEHGHRVYVHPEDVKGKWARRRKTLYWFLILFYMIFPWIHINGKQIIRLDLANREFTFWGNLFFGHDAPLVFFLLLGFVVLFALLTSQWGRVWCGWACPQTVFIDAIFRKIEVLVEGKARARKDLDQSAWSIKKIIIKIIKWSLFLIVSLHLSHTLLGYFVGTRELFLISLHSPLENLTLFLTMLFVTGVILFDFGWFREQFCLIACPYGRFQSVFMDEHSLVVAYDTQRGEPRRGTISDFKNDVSKSEGDCIDCHQCVRVCPTGIDIRRGSQLECIACTMCIDACDGIMEKLHRPPGLIRYDSEIQMAGKKRKFFRPRPLIYSSILLMILGSFSYFLNQRNSLKVQFIRGSSSPYQKIDREDGTHEIVNHYKVSIYYQGEKDLKLFFVPTKSFLPERLRIVTQKVPHLISKGNKQSIDLFFRFQKDLLTNGSEDIKIKILSGEQLENAQLLKEHEVKLVGPF